jgi:hypothetical protein
LKAAGPPLGWASVLSPDDADVAISAFSKLGPLEQLQAVLELGESERECVVLLPRHEPELARQTLTRFLRQVAELLDARTQLRSELVD